MAANEFLYGGRVMNNITRSSNVQDDSRVRDEVVPGGGGDSSKDAQGVQSLETGLRIAFALAQFPGPTGLTELAREVGLSRSKTHRYLVSLCRSGLTIQDGRNGRYDLGLAAVRLGLAAQGRIDEYRIADEIMDELQERTGLSSSAVVWGNHGPTIVRRRESVNPVTVNTRVGSVLPVIASASGRAFAAFLPPDQVNPFVTAEFAAGVQPRHHGDPIDRLGFDEVIQQVRKEGLARVYGDLLVGVDGLAAPVFGPQGAVVMVITLVGPHGAIDTRPGGRMSTVLQTLCNQFSARLGGKSPFANSEAHG